MTAIPLLSPVQSESSPEKSPGTEEVNPQEVTEKVANFLGKLTPGGTAEAAGRERTYIVTYQVAFFRKTPGAKAPEESRSYAQLRDSDLEKMPPYVYYGEPYWESTTRASLGSLPSALPSTKRRRLATLTQPSCGLSPSSTAWRATGIWYCRNCLGARGSRLLQSASPATSARRSGGSRRPAQVAGAELAKGAVQRPGSAALRLHPRRRRCSPCSQPPSTNRRSSWPRIPKRIRESKLTFADA